MAPQGRRGSWGMKNRTGCPQYFVEPLRVSLVHCLILHTLFFFSSHKGNLLTENSNLRNPPHSLRGGYHLPNSGMRK